MTNATLMLQPILSHSALTLDDFITWGGSMARTADGKCHLFFSLWPRMKGHDAWVTDSEIGYAVADNPLGPYKFINITLRGSGLASGWDRDVTHNPTVQYIDGKFYLYYTGNYGNGEYWNHRNNQRIGVAVSEDPMGPWQRFDKPLLDVTTDGWDTLITTNPSVARRNNGGYIMVYKAGSKIAPGPMYGPILHGVAFSDSPLGPFKRHAEPVFASGDVNFPGEDPFVYEYNGKLYAILKDMGSNYTDEDRALVMFESSDGIDWTLCENPMLTSRRLEWSDGTKQEFYRLERPQLYLNNGKPEVLFAAVKPDRKSDDSYNIHMQVTPG